MKFSKKMLLVPFSDNPLTNPHEKYLLDLDEEMERVLKTKNLTKSEKIKLYTQTLARFKEKFNPEDFNNNKLSDSVAQLVQKIKPLETPKANDFLPIPSDSFLNTRNQTSSPNSTFNTAIDDGEDLGTVFFFINS